MSTMTKLEKKNATLARELAEEGIVLLENKKNCLPFGKTIRTVALFGAGARRTIEGGTGSGHVNSRHIVSLEEGLESEGYSIVSKAWLNEFDRVQDEALEAYEATIRELAKESSQKALLTMMGSPFAEPQFRSLTPEELADLHADAAVYVLARKSGEGADRNDAEGDYRLTEQEVHDIQLLSEHYRRFVLVLNVGGPMDLRPVRNFSGLGAILYIGQGGVECGRAAARVLSGTVTPSGKLAATWAFSYEDYPFSEEYADANGDLDDSFYKEGVYVGYRYFDTFGVAPLYSFGHGLSYTRFQMKLDTLSQENAEVVLKVRVTNLLEEYAGKEVVQVYAAPPIESVDRPRRTLVAFAKTKLLAPGEPQLLTIRIPADRLTNYNETESTFELEAGAYTLSLGGSLESAVPCAALQVKDSFVTETCADLFGDAHPEEPIPRPRVETPVPDASLPTLELDESKFFTTMHGYAPVEQRELLSGIPDLTFDALKEGRTTVEDFTACPTVEEMATLCVGSARFSMKDFSVIGNQSKSLPGAAGETTDLLFEKYGIPSAVMADGPAGLRITPVVYEKDGYYLKNPADDPTFRLILPPDAQAIDLSGATVSYHYCTALPTATTLAQTWNMELLETAGDIVGSEMEELGIHLWLAPGMNIQKNPLCGRNFEYYSEDPLLTGLCGAATTKGVQKHKGCGVTIKHIAVNNQETNRNFNNSVVSERALREIYLKGYELCVRSAYPVAAMSSYNLINGTQASNREDLFTHILRNEWGFTGLVMTDWGATSGFGRREDQKYDCASSEGCIAAGNDLIMPGSQRDVDAIVSAVEKGDLPLAKLQFCAGNILSVLIRLFA